MLKCPQCLQLRDDGDTPCPHCGEVPYGIRNRPSQRIADAATPAPREERSKLGYGGEEIDFGDVSTTGLDLAGDDDAPTAPVLRPVQPSLPALKLEPTPGSQRPARTAASPLAPPVHLAMEDAEAKRLADYGDPGPGPFGAVKYWWRVSMRRAELGRRRAEAAGALAGLEVDQTARLAALGRAAEAEHPSDSEPRAGLVRAAGAAQARRDEEAHVSAAVVSEREKRLGDLRVRLTGLQTEIGPIAEAAAGAGRRLDELKTEARRTEAAMKRAEIERRNVVELIAKRQEGFADLSRSAEERNRLLAEIAALDKQNPALNARIDEARAKLEAFAAPVAEAEADHETAGRLLAEKKKLADDVEEKLEEAALELEAERARSGVRFQAADREVEKAWAMVGENVLPTVERSGVGPLAGMAGAAAEISVRVDEASQRLALLERAFSSYDGDVFARGRTLAIVGGALGLVILTILIVVVAS
jgi:hypothetical protein